jgi:hypothetical protein
VLAAQIRYNPHDPQSHLVQAGPAGFKRTYAKGEHAMSRRLPINPISVLHGSNRSPTENRGSVIALICEVPVIQTTAKAQR